MENGTELLRVLDLIGVLANALLGGAIARREGFDPIGFAALAVMSGLGGGLIRDVLLQAGPPVALTDIRYLTTALVGAGIAFMVPFEGRVWARTFPVIDALAVGCWAVAGAQKTLALGLGWLPAVLLGVVTAVGGGAVRDVVLGMRPAIFGQGPLYATGALVASTVLVLADAAGQRTIGAVVATAVGATLCLLARRHGWMLPRPATWRGERSQRLRRRRSR